jgi:imidazolonepropionase-like amidohydrolase
MKTVNLKSLPEAYIWAPRALAGPDLTPTENLLIKIEHNKIASLDHVPKNQVPAAVSQHNHFFCLEDGLILLPSLIDAHVHLALDGSGCNVAPTAVGCDPDPLLRLQQNLDAYLTHGIGAVRDGGDAKGVNLKARNLIRAGTLRGMRIVATGNAIRKTGSYGAFLGGGFFFKNEASAIIAGLVSAGVDQLKVLVSGLVSFQEYGKVEATRFTPAELHYIVSCAHEQGLKVMAHANSDAAVGLAVEAGVDSIEHGYFLSKKTMEKLATRKITWVPTVIPVAVQVKEPLVHRRSPQEVEVITRTYREHLVKLLFARQIGVPLGLGTDSGAFGVRHGASLVDELLLYTGAGLSNQDALQAATIVNSKALGLAETHGSLELQKEPHLIAVRGDPLANLCALKEVKWFFNLS